MNYYVFQGSEIEKDGKKRTARENFDVLVTQHNVWGFGQNTPNRAAIQPGDKVLFYLTGQDNQVFVGAATLKSGAYKDSTSESDQWFLWGGAYRIDLQDVIVFGEPKPRKQFDNLEWRPMVGGSTRISEKDFNRVLSSQTFVPSTISQPADMEFALERYLEEFIIENWDKIDFGEKLTIFEDSNGNRGQQYLAGDAGYIDILAQDTTGQFVVIELKKGRKNDEVVGQVLRYLSWVEDNLSQGASARGLIVVRERDKKLEYALRQVSHKVQAKLYAVSFKLDGY